ncbi:Flagellar M-ring protein [Bosea sp. 62]|uniref:flagellar basal-body MS-ring/collar protein FliF n=1 Tax=unclassified Bosea (in: a-proteobacteria) TaxID=2653178 RepID=UPI001259E783|nr:MULTISPECIES: flagellar basal-body MS-ring/collar protein FliF [unclassified Bosea (in: a-proteobacteria)]CAD5256082.1 Flagellar M-ring protein [Bosea sp. 7B]CAD5274551.1 Flagellar M-ring protein [Bosea sp. 21B]CAD5275755.1 Flagellar M-ring protein [Bosea sp. 46]VVT60086.1 Flagellar M-ring protein [Bosea sp. EC-HK365B]VXB54542.1 Flagellar M-ring protein [Bosea sp. 62]
MNGLVEQFRRFGAARLAAMLAVTLALIGFFAFVMLRMSQPAMGVLFADLSSQDVGAITKDLDTRGIKYELRGDGQTILAPRADVPKLRLELAGKGIPSGGGVGYEIFDKGDAFSSTSFVQNINHLRALEGELSRTIRSIGRVQAARVHLVIPERRLFERDREPPRASIALKLAGDLDNAQVRAIRHLVSSAVDGLKPDRVSIVDERGRLLADGAQGEQGMIGVALDERQGTIERRIKAQVDDIVASIVGPGRARVQVSATLDSNRIESRSETFDPESKVIRSSQNRNEASASNEQREGVTVGNELPGAQQNQGQQQGAQRDTSSKNEEVVNYEISRTTRTEVQEGGRIRKLSVAVLVDGLYSKQGSEVSYQPRPPEELERISQLVRTAVGFDRQRGDQVEVVNLRFAEAPQAPTDLTEQTLIQQLTSFTREDIVRFAEMGVIALLILMVLMVVVRPLLKQVLAPDRELRAIPSFMRNGMVVVDQGTGDPSTFPSVSGSAGTGSGGEGGQIDVEAPSERMLAIAQIKGQLKAQSVEKIGAMVAQNPADSVAVLRSWIHEKAPA